MALKSRSALTPRQRKKVSFWTSAAVLALGCVVLFWDSYLRDGGYRAGAGAPDRRLDDNLYPVDAILGSRPYEDAPVERKAGIVVHLIGVCYMFLALNTVCDVYFTGALEVMVDEWKIKPDVAGATFMAAGGSAPEFFTSLIGSVITVNDVGFGTIVGSAVFNVLFVIGACGFVAPTAIKLSWWPLFRDCSFYIFGLSLLTIFAMDQRITWWEALVLFFAYLLYITIMYFNTYLEKKTDTEFMRRFTAGTSDEDAPSKASRVAPGAGDLEAGAKKPGKEDPLRDTAQKTTEDQPGPPEHHKPVVEETEAEDITEDDKGSGGPGKAPALAGEPAQPGRPEDKKEEGEEGEEEEDEDAIEEMMTIPESGKWRYFWFVCCPVYILLYYGIPRPTPKLFMFSFGVSLLWIAGFAFCLVWWCEIMLGALGIDPIIQGLTILAAGTSIPDMASSVAVTRRGEGDMAVSSSIGSNIFDILVGLPIPWMIKIGLVEGLGRGNPGFEVALLSEYLAFYVLVLLFMVFAVVVFIHLLGWRLNKKLGVCMGFLYGIFLVLCIAVEYGKPESLKMGSQ